MSQERSIDIIREIKRRSDYEIDEPITYQSFSSILDQIVK